MDIEGNKGIKIYLTAGGNRTTKFYQQITLTWNISLNFIIAKIDNTNLYILFALSQQFMIYNNFNPLSANPKNRQTLNCLSVFDDFVGLALKELI